MTALIVGLFLLAGGFGCGIAFAVPVVSKYHAIDAKVKVLESIVAQHAEKLKAAL